MCYKAYNDVHQIKMEETQDDFALQDSPFYLHVDDGLCREMNGNHK